MSRPILLYLTDLSNGDEGEDILISNWLRQFFGLVLCHPADCERTEDEVDEIIIRNVWNENSYPPPHPDYLERFMRKKLVIHDDLYRSSSTDKTYLVDLSKRGYPVIPTVDSVEDINRLPLVDVSRARNIPHLRLI